MRRIILFTLTVIICSCGRNTDAKQNGADTEIKELRIVSRIDSIITNLSEIASDVEYIPLQLSNNTPIGAIDKIVTRHNKIYINLISNIICFDNQGHFLYKLYGNGKGDKDNSVAIYDFDIDSSDSSLIVLYGNKILLYDITESGFDYVRTIKLGRLSPTKLDFAPGTNNILLSSYRRKGFEPILHILINMNGDTLSFKRNYFNRFNPVKNQMWDRVIHYHFDNKLNFRERFNDTVFSINIESNNFTPTLILVSRISSTNSENINDPDYFKILPNVNNIFEVPRYLYYTYSTGKIDYKVFYDKYEEKMYRIDPKNGSLKDDISGGPYIEPEFCSGDKIYSWIRVRDLKKYIGSEDYAKVKVPNPNTKEDLKIFSDSLKEPYNQVLIIVTPKN